MPKQLTFFFFPYSVRGFKNNEGYLLLRKESPGRVRCYSVEYDFFGEFPAHSVWHLWFKHLTLSMEASASPCYCLVANIESNPSAENLHVGNFAQHSEELQALSENP